MGGSHRILSGRGLRGVQVAWLALASVLLALFGVSLPAYYEQLHTLSALEPADAEALRGGLAQLGLAPTTYGAYILALESMIPLTFVGVALALVARKPGDRMALYTATALLTFGISGSRSLQALAFAQPALVVPVKLVGLLGFVLFFTLFYLFPDGRFVPYWTRWLAAGWLVEEIGHYFLPEATSEAAPFVLLFLGLIASAIFAQGYRYWRVSSSVERQQTKWVVFGLTISVLGFIAYGLTDMLARPGLEQVLHELIGGAILVGCLLLTPLSIGFAILRYRLWNIDLLINRALVYGVLTVSVVGLYVLLVVGAGALVQSSGRLPISLVATGLVALVFQPLRDRLQRTVNRLMYGERDEPYAVVAQLGRRLEATVDAAAMLPTTVETLAQALRLPSIAIALRLEAGHMPVVAAHGPTTPGMVAFPLAYQGQTIGELRVAPRPGEAGLAPSDARLLADLARQIGPAAYAVLLVADLERARLRVVTEREEARRQLGNDLHDGLGHQLTALARLAEATTNVLERDPVLVRDWLGEIARQSRVTSEHVRRLAHQLHPPELEVLGLVAALRERAEALQGEVRVQVEAPVALPPLPVAVETAAYYIAHEALANVQRHAGARRCWLRVALRQGVNVPRAVLPALDVPVLELEIADDGCGIVREAGRRDGLGLVSMRQRAAEVGGVCTLSVRPGGGTVVSVRLPCPDDVSGGRSDGADPSSDRG